MPLQATFPHRWLSAPEPCQVGAIGCKPSALPERWSSVWLLAIASRFGGISHRAILGKPCLLRSGRAVPVKFPVAAVASRSWIHLGQSPPNNSFKPKTNRYAIVFGLTQALALMCRLIAIICLVLLASCASSRKFVRIENSHLGPTATSEQDCAAVRGEWRHHGISVSRVCVVPTTDGGKTCKDTSDCQGTCQAASGTKAGQKVLGVCAEIFRPACSQPVVRGIAQPRICE